MPYLNRIPCVPEPIDCRILTAALDLFVSRGYHNVSVHDVQKEANVSIGSIYNHFGGKEGIAKALYFHLLNEMEEMIDTVMRDHYSATRRCETIIRLLFEYTETRANIIAYIFHAKHTEFIPGESPICDSSPFAKMRGIVQQGMESGEFRSTDPWVATASVFGGAIRMIQLRLDGVIQQPLGGFLDEVLESAWQGMRVERASESV